MINISLGHVQKCVREQPGFDFGHAEVCRGLETSLAHGTNPANPSKSVVKCAAPTGGSATSGVSIRIVEHFVESYDDGYTASRRAFKILPGWAPRGVVDGFCNGATTFRSVAAVYVHDDEDDVHPSPKHSWRLWSPRSVDQASYRKDFIIEDFDAV